VRYAGWDLDQFFFTARITETARITVAVAPDNALEALLDLIASARESILIETLTFENLNVADGLSAALDRGVAVTVLLECGPTGGISDQERAICRQLELAGGACWFMISDADESILDRYSYLHAKFILVDGARVAIGSENLSLNSLPADDKTDGTTGRRGVYLITDAPRVAAHVGRLFAADLQPRNETEHTGHIDLRRWNASDPVYGLPSPGYVPIEASGGISYPVRYPQPAVFEDAFAFEIVQSPENSLRDRDSLLGLIGRAGAGDVVLSQQLDEPPNWGVNADGTLNPNQRLEAILAAARRGATVRLLLDSLMDDTASSTSNRQTCDEVRALALAENLDIQCAQANPTGLGIHNKMVLVRVAGAGYVHVGSINGSEQSSKGNRELALQVGSNALYTYLAAMFQQDWPHRLFVPTALNGYDGAANSLLITEILPDPTGPDGPEFIEIGNPTNREINLEHFALSDAVAPEDFEDVRRFPPGTRLAPGQMLVVAFEAVAFRSAFGRSPDFEIIDSDSLIPDLVDDLAWGDPEALLQLGNGGDEIALRDSTDAIVDLVVYGAGIFPGVTACPLPANGHALVREPWWRDGDHCPGGFAERFPPTPGTP
jgi:phosphatidylserine/phosphatidylglycerophosphate/cardiolipin synthase-like enzyme